MKWRIVEYQPERYRAERKIVFWWRLKLMFSEIDDAEDHIRYIIWNDKRKKKLKRFRAREVLQP